MSVILINEISDFTLGHKMNQSEVAEFLGVNRQTISQRLKDKNPRKAYIRTMIKMMMGLSKKEAERVLAKIDEAKVAEASEDIVTEKELVPIIGYSVNTLRQWRSEGKGPPYTVKEGNGRDRIRYSVEKAKEWKEEHKKAKKA